MKPASAFIDLLKPAEVMRPERQIAGKPLLKKFIP
jgi:hypothetical protein